MPYKRKLYFSHKIKDMEFQKSLVFAQQLMLGPLRNTRGRNSIFPKTKGKDVIFYFTRLIL